MFNLNHFNMKTKLLLLIVFIALFADFAANAQVPARKGWWKFDDPTNLMKATIGNDLVPSGTGIVAIDGPSAGNGAIFNPRDNYFSLDHGILPNGGGLKVNVYSIQVDFSVADITGYNSFWQTGAPNDFDGDLFIKGGGIIGLTDLGWSTEAIAADTWYRLIFTYDGSVARFYINGVLWVEKTGLAVDSRFALAPIMSMFADDDGETKNKNCSEISIWDVALTQADATLLGDASTVLTSVNRYQKRDNSDLDQNYPNPFNSTTKFQYQVQKTGDVSLRILDLTGREISVINEGVKSAGNHSVDINAGDLKRGTYFVQMTSNGRKSTRKMVVAK